MANINLKFGKTLKQYGAVDFNACYNCGTCTAVCALSTEEDSFPREMIRFSTLGQQNDIQSSLKPWLCYYCGECSTSCPQQAQPGELMMALRRWLTSRYDWTGLSGILYRNFGAYLIALFILLIGVIGFAHFSSLNKNSIVHYGHLFEIVAISGVFAFILLPNLIRMWYFTIIKPKHKASLSDYFSTLSELFLHMFSQKRFLSCDNTKEAKAKWFMHFILVLSYLSLLFTTVALDWFSTSSKFIIWTGYVESAAIFIITTLFIQKRIRKIEPMHEHSQPSDWFFVIWLFLMGISAFSVRLAIDTDILTNNFWIFTIHLTVLVQWALVIVPFGKWTHFLYRSFAMYFNRVIKRSES